MADVTRVDIEPINLTDNGQRYRVTYAGEVLVEGRRNPVFGGCRALLARGITGRLAVWGTDNKAPTCNSILSASATLALWESEGRSLRTVAWRPRVPDAVSLRAAQAQTATDQIPVPEPV
jgi:hypothetical protein